MENTIGPKPPVSKHILEDMFTPLSSEPLTAGDEEAQQIEKEKFNSFFIDGPLADLANSGTSPTQNLKNNTLSAMSSLAGNAPLTDPADPTVTPPPSTLKTKAADLAKNDFKEQVDAVMRNPNFEDAGKAMVIRSLFDEHAADADPDTLKSYLKVLTDTSVNKGTKESKTIKQFVSDNLQEYEDYLRKSTLLQAGSGLEGFEDIGAGDAESEDFALQALAPLTYTYQLNSVMAEILPDVVNGTESLLVSGETRKKFKAALRAMPQDQQAVYAEKITNILNSSDYFGVENDFIKADLAQALLDWEDHGDIEVFADNVIGGIEAIGIIPVIGSTIKTGSSAGRALMRKIMSRIAADGRTLGDKMQDILRLRPKENSPWAIANTIDPEGAQATAHQILQDPTGRLGEAAGVSKETLTVETMFPKMAGSKVTPGTSINLNDGFLMSQFSPEEIKAAQKDLGDRLGEEIGSVRAGIGDAKIAPNNIFYKVDGDDILVEEHVTRSDNHGFSTLEHAEAVARSYENQLINSEAKDFSVEIHMRNPGTNEYIPLPKGLPPELIEGSDFRPVIKIKEPISIDAHALSENAVRPDKVSGYWARAFDRSVWGKDWFTWATNISSERNSRLNRSLTEIIQPFNKLKSSQHREVFKLLDEGQDAKRWWSPQEVKDKIGHLPDFEDLYHGYYAAVKHQQASWKLHNYGYRQILEGEGYKELFFKDTQFFSPNVKVDPELSSANVIAKPINFLPSDVKRVYDPELDAIREITDRDRQMMKDGLLNVYETKSTTKKGINEIKHIVSPKTDTGRFSVNELPAAVINNEPGYIARKYDAGYLIQKTIMVRDYTGAMVPRPVTLGIERNVRDADILLDELRAEWKSNQITLREDKYKSSKAKRLEKFEKLVAEKVEGSSLAKMNREVIRLRTQKSKLAEQLRSAGFDPVGTAPVFKDFAKALKSAQKLGMDDAAITKLGNDFIEKHYQDSLKVIADGSLVAARKRITDMVAKRAQEIDKAQTKKLDKLKASLDKRASTEITRTYAKEMPSSFSGDKYFDPLNTEWLEDSGQLYTSPRKMDEILGKYEDSVDPVTGQPARRRRRVVAPINESFESGRMSAARVASLDISISKLVNNWNQRFGEIFKKETSSGFPWMGDLPVPDNMPSYLKKDYDDAIAMAEYIRRFAGMDDDSVQKFTRRLMVVASEKLLTNYKYNWQTKLAEGLVKNRDLNLISKAKSVAFFQLITARPFRQAVLQASQMSMYMNRGDYAKYFFMDGAKGMTEYATIWAGMMSKSTKQYERFAPDYARAMGITKKQFDELITAYIDSGLPASIDSHLWITASTLPRNLSELSGAESAVGDALFGVKRAFNTAHKWVRRVGFDLGEQSQILMAFLAEKRAWQIANNDITDELWKKPNNLLEITGRARALSGNMNQAGAMGYQSGPLSGMFQFMSHTTKMAQMITPSHLPNGPIAKKILRGAAGKRIPGLSKIASEAISNQEKYRIFLTQAAIYGTGGLGITRAYEGIREWYTEETGQDVPREVTMIVEEGIMGTMLNAGLSAISGQDVDLEISKSISPLGGAIGLNVNNPVTAVYSLIMNTNAGADDWAGPGFDVLKRMYQGIGTFFKMLVDDSVVDTDEKLAAMLLQLSTSLVLETDPIFLARYENTIEAYLSRQGNIQTQENQVARLSKVYLGIRSRKSREFQEDKMAQKGVFAGYEKDPDEDYDGIRGEARSDFEIIKRTWHLLDKGEVSREDFENMLNMKSDKRAATMGERALSIYRTELRNKLNDWYEDEDISNWENGIKGSLENQAVKRMEAMYKKESVDTLEGMLARIKNLADFPKKDQLIEKLEREIERD
jgi:hypothetical protein